MSKKIKVHFCLLWNYTLYPSLSHRNKIAYIKVTKGGCGLTSSTTSSHIKI